MLMLMSYAVALRGLPISTMLINLTMAVLQTH